MRYLCTFGSGWSKAIKNIFVKDFVDYRIKSLNNVYLLLKDIKCNTTNFDKSVNSIINDLKINYNDIKKNLNLSV